MRRMKKIVKKLKTNYVKSDIYITPEDGKYDSCLIWMHGLGDSADGFYSTFYENRLLGVKFIFSFK